MHAGYLRVAAGRQRDAKLRLAYIDDLARHAQGVWMIRAHNHTREGLLQVQVAMIANEVRRK